MYIYILYTKPCIYFLNYYEQVEGGGVCSRFSPLVPCGPRELLPRLLSLALRSLSLLCLVVVQSAPPLIKWQLRHSGRFYYLV